MSNDVVDQLDQFPLEEFSSPLSGQIFELCDPDLFSEVNSNSNCCYDANSSYGKDFNSFTPDVLENNEKTNTATTTSTANSSANASHSTIINNINNLSIIFDSSDDVENDVNDHLDLATIPHLYSTTDNDNQNQMDFSSIQGQLQYDVIVSPNVPLAVPPLNSVLDDECLTFMPPNLRTNSGPLVPCNAYIDSAIGSYFPNNLSSLDNPTIVNSGLYLNCNNEIQIQDLEFQADNGGIFTPDGLSRLFNPKDLQTLSEENQHAANGVGGTTPLASELSSLDDSTFKICKLSPEERREKIHRYMKKRNERNFSKKIKYACRKTLADSRPRVRGRFAKNDELISESIRAACSNHEEDIDEDSMPIVVKEEDMFDSSDIFAHISGVNSLKCNYSSIQSWI